MGKYDPLLKHLERLPSARIPMRFDEIEAILGFRLPPSSRRHRAWWSNNPSNSAITRAWIDAGYRTEAVDLADGKLVFSRASSPRKTGPDPGKPTRHPILGCMKGTVTLAPGVDLTSPADPDWGRTAHGERS
jgi:hypothetical protein